MQLTPIRFAIDDPGTPPPAPVPTDSPFSLISHARVLVKGMVATQDLGSVGAARADALKAVKMLSAMTNVDVIDYKAFSLTLNHVLDAAAALDKVTKSLQLVDNGLGQKFAYDALDAADRLLDKAWKTIPPLRP